MENRDIILDEHVKFLDEEMEIRVECMKIELEELLQVFRAELSSVKKNLIEYIIIFY